MTVLMNHTIGPDSILEFVEARRGGQLEDVMSFEKMTAHAAKYEAVAGSGIDAIQASPRTLDNGAR